MNDARRYENEGRRYDQDQQHARRNDERGSQWRDQGDGRFAGADRRGDEQNWEWNGDRSSRGTRESYSGNGGDSWNRGMDGGYRGGERRGRMAGGFDSDRWMESPPQPMGERDSSRSWRGTGDNSYSGYQGGGYQDGGYQGGGYQDGGYQSDPSRSGAFQGGSRESYTGRGPKGYRRSDDRIREDVSDRLTDDDALDASEIEVEVKDGEVTLKGTVSDRQQKRRAEDIAESCSGVADVTNSIRVSRGDQADHGRDSQSRGQKSSKRTGSDASV